MSGKLPSRGPRVMHGVGKLVAQARNLVPAGPAQAEMMGLDEYAARMTDLAVLVQRCNEAERRVARVQQVTDAFSGQVQQLAPEHPARKLAEQIVATYREAIK
jgi:hypothetical protein